MKNFKTFFKRLGVLLNAGDNLCIVNELKHERKFRQYHIARFLLKFCTSQESID